jgi:hypothetical protein
MLRAISTSAGLKEFFSFFATYSTNSLSEKGTLNSARRIFTSAVRVILVSFAVLCLTMW